MPHQATDRTQAISQWLSTNGYLISKLQPASNDASFRRYFRVLIDQRPHIVMDAPPEQEDCRAFIHITKHLDQIGLYVPKVLNTDLEQGFLLLTDLGDCRYLDTLNTNNADRLYGDAFDALVILQASRCDVPTYHRQLLLDEMQLFRQWFLQKQLQINLEQSTHSMLDNLFQALIDNALEQPDVLVHRDYHSRNLMLTPEKNPGILDFQDAVYGPITYDLVSLLKDCYIAWPPEQVTNWVLRYHALAKQSGLLPGNHSDKRFLRWFDLMGVQRHLKAIGIFSRLNHRDNKPGYLADIPRTLQYIEQVSIRYPLLNEFGDWLRSHIIPRLNQ